MNDSIYKSIFEPIIPIFLMIALFILRFHGNREVIDIELANPLPKFIGVVVIVIMINWFARAEVRDNDS